MPSQDEKHFPALLFDPEMVAQLACPVCFADLRLADQRLVCGGCRRIYPIVEGIPVLIQERADPPTQKP